MCLKMMNRNLEKIANFSSLFLCIFPSKIVLTIVYSGANINSTEIQYIVINGKGKHKI